MDLENEMPARAHDPLPEAHQKIQPLCDDEIAILLARRKGGSKVGQSEWALINRMMDHYLALRGREHLIP